jgi:O-antigen/teichoic acid export membrane protein
MVQQNRSSSNMAKATLWLVLFQMLGLLIPLLTLPILARGLGVAVFGQLMLAQAVVFLAVVFVDAGFNTESQRRLSLAENSLECQQVLIDNFIARSICSIPIILMVVLVGYFIPGLPFLLVIISLLLVFGTLLLPQWWYIAQQEGLKLGIIATTGRVLSAIVIFMFVRSPQDVLIAAIATCGATLVSGCMLLPQWWKVFHPHKSEINWKSWRVYLGDVRHTIFSGFFSSASASVPVLALGFFSGTFQAGLFTAADRLTRAAAHMLSFIEQSFMGWLAKTRSQDPQRASQMRTRMLFALMITLLIGASMVAVLAPWILHLLYGNAFLASTSILQALSFWFFIFGLRKAALAFYWSVSGDLKVVAIFQWAEAVLVCLLAICGALWSGGLGVALGLCMAEILLIAGMITWQRKERR